VGLVAGPVALIACAAAVLAVRWDSIFPKSPRLQVPEGIVQLGEFAPGERGTAVSLRNTGRMPLLISGVQSTCSCAVVKPPRKIDPGESADLRLSLNVRPGPGFADVTLHSNDPRGARSLSLRWHGSVAPEIYPPKVFASDLPLDRPYERIVQVVYPGGRAAVVPTVLRTECDAPGVQMETLDNDPLALRTTSALSPHTVVGRLNIRLRIPPPPEPGTVRASCRLSVRYGRETYELRLPVEVSFAGRVAAEPGEVIFAAERLSELLGRKRQINVSAADGCGEVTLVSCPDWLSCRVTRVSATRYNLELEVSRIPRDLSEHSRLVLGSGANPAWTTGVNVCAFALSRQ
jgi:hypothetical protein